MVFSFIHACFLRMCCLAFYVSSIFSLELWWIMWWRTERSQVTNAIKPFSTIENVLDDAWDGFA